MFFQFSLVGKCLLRDCLAEISDQIFFGRECLFRVSLVDFLEIVFGKKLFDFFFGGGRVFSSRYFFVEISL